MNGTTRLSSPALRSFCAALEQRWQSSNTLLLQQRELLLQFQKEQANNAAELNKLSSVCLQLTQDNLAIKEQNRQIKSDMLMLTRHLAALSTILERTSKHSPPEETRKKRPE